MGNDTTLPMMAPLESALAELKVRRAKLDAAISAIEDILGSASGSSATAQSSTEGAAVSGPIAEDAFFGMTIPDATRKFLKMARKPQSAAEIARALEAGGMTHQSKYLPNTVRTTLIRIAQSGGDLVQVKKDWALAEWYPGLRRKKEGVAPAPESEDGRAEEEDE